jgi:hypothetical protein
LEEEFFEWKDILIQYNQNKEFYTDDLNQNMLGAYDFELVVYDEIEKFRAYDNDLFEYPYEDRKTKLNSFNLDTRDFKLGNPNS